YEESSPQAEAQRHRRDRLFALLDQAASFYERVLWAESGEAVQEYLASRGLGEEVCREFRIGLSPAGSTLAKKAREKGFTAEELEGAGLVTRRGSDYFQRRLMFPLPAARGRLVGVPGANLPQEEH